MEEKRFTKIVVGKTIVVIVEIETKGNYKTYRVNIDGKNITNVKLQCWQCPSCAVADQLIYVWGGSYIYEIHRNGLLKELKFDEEILAIFHVDGRYLLVCELSARLLNTDLTEVHRYNASGVLSGMSWRGDMLDILEEGRQIGLRILDNRLEITYPSLLDRDS